MTKAPSKRLICAWALVLGALGALLVPPGIASAAPATFVFKGSGWGHRVGLSQYGALEQAKDGRGWKTILGHYYKGTSFGSNNVPAALRVHLAGAVPQVTVEAGSRFTFTSDGTEIAASPGGDGRWTVRQQPVGSFTIFRPNGTPAGVPVTASRPLKINYEPSSTIVTVQETGARYRWGKLELSPSGDKIRVILDIATQRYLRGLAEVPASWPIEALRAQAVAARTYAADKALRAGHHRSGCDCTLFSDTRDQVYRGYEREDPAVSNNSRWVAAVDDTAGQVVQYSSKPIQAYYHSSSGGKTEAAGDVWSSDLPYLKPVADEWSLRSSNPYARWEVRLAQEEVAARLGFKRVDSIEVKSKTAGGGVKEAVVRGNETKTYKGTDLRSKLALRSTMFQIAGSQAAIWTPWRRVQSGDNASSGPDVVSWEGALHAVMTDASGVPLASRRDPDSGAWSAWNRIGRASSRGSDPDIAVAPNGAVHAVLRGAAGDIYVSRRDPGSGSWSAWQRLGTAKSRGRDPSIAVGPDGFVWVAMTAQSSPNIYATRRDPGTGVWSDFVKVGNDGQEPVVGGLAGTAVVVARGGDGAVKSSTFAGGWGAWRRVANGSGRSPAVVSYGGRLILVVRGNSKDRLYTSTLSGGSWSSWAQVSADLVASGAAPSVLVDLGGVAHVFVRGPNDVIYTASKGKGGWAGFFQVGENSDRAAAGSIVNGTAVRGRVYSLIRGRGGGVYWAYRTS